MRKKYSHEKLFMGNKFILLCVLFTINITLQGFIIAINEGQVDFTLEFVISNFIIVSAPILPLAVLDFLLRHYIDEEHFIAKIAIYIHYPISLGLLLLFTFFFNLINSVPSELSMLVRVAVNYTIVYIGIVAGAMLIAFMQTSTANKQLKSIHESQNKIKNHNI